MDKYKNLFEKGKDAYLSALESINWFDNKYLSKEKIIRELEECNFPPYYLLSLSQVSFDSEGFDEEIDSYKNLMKQLTFFSPNSKFTIEGTVEDFSISTIINNNEYKIEINDSIKKDDLIYDNTELVIEYIDNIIVQEIFEYKFYELPPADQAYNLIFVKPEIYNKALEIGIIPDFIGYLAVNY